MSRIRNELCVNNYARFYFDCGGPQKTKNDPNAWNAEEKKRRHVLKNVLVTISGISCWSTFSACFYCVFCIAFIAFTACILTEFSICCSSPAVGRRGDSPARAWTYILVGELCIQMHKTCASTLGDGFISHVCASLRLSCREGLDYYYYIILCELVCLQVSLH